MTDDNDGTTRLHQERAHQERGGQERAERDLDRMLDLVEAPSPSDLLRARLMRDYVPEGAAAGAPGNASRALSGALPRMAAAAALVLAVAAGILSQPPEAGTSQRAVAPAAMVAVASPVAGDTETADGTLDPSDDDYAALEDWSSDGFSDVDANADRVIAASPPDSAAFMMASLDIGLRIGEGGSNATGAELANDEPFEGVPLE